MKLYHGTNSDFSHIDLGLSKPNKDFGKGFYLSADYNQALQMAQIKVRQLKSGKAIVQTYEIEDNAFSTLRVLRFDKYSEEWASFIVANRNNSSLQPIHDFDIVIGPIADDRVGAQLWHYENHFIDLATLVERLKYIHGITIQYFFGTHTAISHLKRIL